VGGESPGRAAAGTVHPAHGPAYWAPQRPALQRPVLHVYGLTTVPLLLIEMILVMKVPEAETVLLSRELGTASTIMVVSGHPGEVQMGHHGLCGPPSSITGGAQVSPVLDLAGRRAVALPVRRCSRLPWAREAAACHPIVSWITYPFSDDIKNDYAPTDSCL
jgi:hypothetical protein